MNDTPGKATIPSAAPERVVAEQTPAVPASRGLRFPAANSLVTGMALSASAGFLDAFTYVGHGHVFASAMTGNMVLLGVHIASDKDILSYLLPILAYAVGVVLAHGMMRPGPRRLLRYKPHVFTLWVEILVLTFIALIPHHLQDELMVPIITVSTAMQNTSFRNIGTRTYNSVIMTGNLQALSNALAAGLAPLTPAKLAEARDLGAILLSFVSGAALGTFLTPSLGLHVLVLPASVLAAGSVILLLSDDGAKR